MTFADFSRKYDSFVAPSFKVSVDEQDIVRKHLVEVISVTFEDALDVSHRFAFTVNDPEFKWLDSSLFEPGKIVEVKMGYRDKLSTMIVGEITSLMPSFPPAGSGAPQIEISGYDLFYQYTRASKNKTWKNKRDSEVVEEIMKSGPVKNKLTPHIERTDVVFPETVQNGETDYAFIKKLAERNFFQFSIKEKDVYFGSPEKNKTPIITLEYGRSLLSFNPELNTANQVSQVIVRGWNPIAKKEIVGKSKSAKGGEGQSGGEMMAKIYGTVEQRVTDKTVSSQQDADNLANSIFNKLSVGLVRGSAECIGIPEIRAGAIIILKGLGKKFSQKYFIERSTHSVSSSGYKTTFNVRGDIT